MNKRSAGEEAYNDFCSLLSTLFKALRGLLAIIGLDWLLGLGEWGDWFSGGTGGE